MIPPGVLAYLDRQPVSEKTISSPGYQKGLNVVN
jgi:hypothetical protein